MPAPNATEIDPDGAGDIFAAGYVVASAMGETPLDCVRVGFAIASASVEVRGPLESTILPIAHYLGRAPRESDPPA